MLKKMPIVRTKSTAAPRLSKAKWAALVALQTLLLTPMAAGQIGLSQTNLVNIGGTATDQNGAAFTVAGMSGIAARGGNQYIAVMDNSNKLVFITIIVGDDGTILSAAITGGLSLSQTHDFEGVAYNATANSVFLSEENTPAVHEYSLANGQRLRTLATPAIYSQRRANFGFESLAAAGDQSNLWTANEEALAVDGPLSTTSTGTVVRLLRLDRVGGAGGAYAAVGQFAYQCAPIHGSFISSSRSGLSDLLQLADGTLLSLERSFALARSGCSLTVCTKSPSRARRMFPPRRRSPARGIRP